MAWNARPKLVQAWPTDAIDLPGDQIVALYHAGFCGAVPAPEEKEALRDYIVAKGWDPNGDSVAHAYGFADTGKGKLILPFLNVWKLWPKCWGGPYQRCNDCVSWGLRNAILISLASEIIAGGIDEKTGRPEMRPAVSETAETNSVLASEYLYWFRNVGGDNGWSCPAGARAAIDHGFMLRQDYPELGVNFEEYNARTATQYGRGRRPPENIVAAGKVHHVRATTELTSPEQVRDFLANGFGINGCSSCWADDRRGRDENGVAGTMAGGGHAQAIIGYDDRPETIQQYGEPLWLELNSWPFSWIKGGRRIRGTNIDIPEGSAWQKASVLRKKDLWASSSVAGWVAPTWKEALGDNLFS